MVYRIQISSLGRALTLSRIHPLLKQVKTATSFLDIFLRVVHAHESPVWVRTIWKSALIVKVAALRPVALWMHSCGIKVSANRLS